MKSDILSNCALAIKQLNRFKHEETICLGMAMNNQEAFVQLFISDSSTILQNHDLNRVFQSMISYFVFKRENAYSEMIRLLKAGDLVPSDSELVERLLKITFVEDQFYEYLSLLQKNQQRRGLHDYFAQLSKVLASTVDDNIVQLFDFDSYIALSSVFYYPFYGKSSDNLQAKINNLVVKKTPRAHLFTNQFHYLPKQGCSVLLFDSKKAKKEFSLQSLELPYHLPKEQILYIGNDFSTQTVLNACATGVKTISEFNNTESKELIDNCVFYIRNKEVFHIADLQFTLRYYFLHDSLMYVFFTLSESLVTKFEKDPKYFRYLAVLANNFNISLIILTEKKELMMNCMDSLEEEDFVQLVNVSRNENNAFDLTLI